MTFLAYSTIYALLFGGVVLAVALAVSFVFRRCGRARERDTLERDLANAAYSDKCRGKLNPERILFQ